MKVLASEVCACEERKKRNDWYEEECLYIKVAERNKAWVKMLKTEYLELQKYAKGNQGNL